MSTISLSHASWLRPFNTYFDQQGIDLAPYYDGAKISEEITATEDAWLTKQQLYRFLNLVAEGERMPELGFVVGERITPDSIEALNTEIAQAETLREAIHHFCRLINRHVENNRAWLEDGMPGELWFLNQTDNPFEADRRIADHAGLMTLINVVRLFAGPDWFPEKVRLQTGPTTAIKKVSGLDHATVEFDAAATGLAFPSLWLFRHINGQQSKTANDTIDDLLLRHEELLREKLARLLSPLIGAGGMAPSLEMMAHVCDLNPRTLQRRLREEGATFGTLLEQIRMQKATALLQTDWPIKEIAWELGYSGANNFIRAFKRHTDMTPSAYRQKNP